MQLFHFDHCKRHLKKRTIALDSLPPPPQRTLCTLVKMMTIMDDPLQGKRLAVVAFGPAWHCYSGQRAAYASGPTLTDSRHDEQRGSPYDAKCNVAEIGAVNMGEIGAVRKRSR